MKHISILMSAFLLLLGGLGGWPRPAYADDTDIIFSEVMFNATCKGTDDTTCGTASTDETHFEWVEIKNKGSIAVNLNGWQICDLGGSLPSCASLPDVSIGAAEYWIITYNTTALQTEFDQYTPAKTVIGDKTISLNRSIGSGLNNSTAEGVYFVNADVVPQDVTCVSWGATNTLCSTRTTLGSKTDTSLTTSDGQSITNIAGAWYRHGPSNSAQQASPYSANANTAGATAVTLRSMKASGRVSPFSVAVPLIIALAGGVALLYRRRRKETPASIQPVQREAATEYAPPAITYESRLEVRAGSPLSPVFDPTNLMDPLNQLLDPAKTAMK